MIDFDELDALEEQRQDEVEQLQNNAGDAEKESHSMAEVMQQDKKAEIESHNGAEMMPKVVEKVNLDTLWPRPPGLPPLVSDEAPAMLNLRDMTDEQWAAQPKRTWPHPVYNRIQHRKMGAQDEPGKFFGLVFPYTHEGIAAAGPEWLTKAFHTAGTLPRSNKVVTLEVIPISCDPMEGEAVGGSSVKAILKVSYERNAPGLHRSLFCKLPLPLTEGSERLTSGKNWWLDEPEGIFNLIANSCPFRTAKCYFWDFSPVSTNFLHIWEAVEFSDEWEPKVPWVLAKPGLKNRDYEIPKNGLERYLAFVRGLARLAAQSQNGKIGDKRRMMELFEDLEPLQDDFKVDPMKSWPRTEEQKRKCMENLKDPGFQALVESITAPNVGMAEMNLSTGLQLVLHVSPQLFEPAMRDRKFCQKFAEEVMHYSQYQWEIEMWSFWPELYGLTHRNTQLDNALYYYTDDACTNMECFIIDWAAVAGTLVLGPLAGNLVSGAEPKMLEEHLPDLVKMWVETFHAEGGSLKVTIPVVDRMVRLFMCGSIVGLMGFLRTITANLPVTSKLWKDFSSRWDSRVNDFYVRRAAIAQFNHALECWMSPKLKLYRTFTEWLAENKALVLKKEKKQFLLPAAPPKMHTEDFK